jgi:hypothetical protein
MRRLIPILVLAVLLTGCKVKVDQGFELNSDGSGTASIVFGFDEELMELMGSFAPGDDPLDQITSDLPAGWDASDWSEGAFTGLEASTEFDNLAELHSLASMVFSGEDGLFETFLVQETGDGGFRFEAAMSGETLEEGLQGVEGFDLGGSINDLSEAFFDAEIKVKFPGDIVNHNADAQEGDGTLVWNVHLTDSGRVIRAESAPGGGLPLIPIAGAAALLLAIGVVTAVRRRGPSHSVIVPDGETATPVAVPAGRPVDGDPFG